MSKENGGKFCSLQFLVIIFILLLLAPSATFSQKDGDVKLVNGPTSYQGTVAVYYKNAWGTICDDSWSFNDASVICRQLGHVRAERTLHSAYYGQGPGRILVDEIRCPFGTSHILGCTPKMDDWGKHDCTHLEDAGVDCIRKTPRTKPHSMPLQLRCPDFIQSGSCKNCTSKVELTCANQTLVEGVVFAQYNNIWRPVSGEDFGEEEAKVVCGELGYTLSSPNPPLSSLWSNWDGQYCKRKTSGSVAEGSGDGNVLQPVSCSPDELTSNNAFRTSLQSTLLRNLECKGDERRLLDCYFSRFGPTNVLPVNVATVRCGFRPHPSCSSTCNNKEGSCEAKEKYRLKSGLYPWLGRVEVLHEGKWWAVDSRDWDYPEATIVCRALGYSGAKSYNVFHGRASGSALYTYLRCIGNEATLADCTQKSFALPNDHYYRQDAGVECSVPQTCAISAEEEVSKFESVRLYQYPYNVNHFASVKGPHGWGIACYDMVNARAANVLCRVSQRMFGTRVRSASITGKSYIFYNGSMNCTGNEMSLKECNMTLIKQDKCEHQEAVLDCTPGMPDLVPDVATLHTSVYYYPYVTPLPMYYLDCALDENCLSSSAKNASYYSSRFLLRFSSLTMNWGTTDFQPYVGRDGWQYHTCHRHYHSFETFVNYDLLNVVTGEKAAEGHKASFCLEDSTCRNGASPRHSCSRAQGISPNCGDLYGSHLDCQWIDITDVPPGTYVLRLHVNPEYLIGESDYDNNIASCRITIRPEYHYRRVTTEACWLSDH